MEVIVSHMNIDFDGLACLLAAHKLHPQATVALTDKQQPTVKSYLAIYRDQLNFSSYEQIPWTSVTKIILVDVGSLDRTGIPLKELRDDISILIYDHHLQNEPETGAEYSLIEAVGAAITLLTEQLLKRDHPINAFEATLFGLGLYTDTGNFTYPQVTARDLYIASVLREQGMDVSLIERFAEQVLTTEEKALFQTLLTNSEEQQREGLTILLTTHEQDHYQGGLATLTRRLMDITDSDAAIAIVMMKDRTYVVARASSSRIDFNPLMQALGGGGHAQAASATFKHKSLTEIVPKVMELVPLILKQAVTASSIMASPVKSVVPTDKIEAVLERMFQYGHTGFPVVDENGQLVGVISRRDVDKATHHGLGHAPVKAYMSSRPVILPPEATIEEIQATMMQHNIGRIPIVENGALVGIVSRTDVIEQLHQQSSAVELTAKDSLLPHMKASLPASTLTLLKQIGEIADELDLPVYLIGGIVRDLLLKRQNEDIDLVVEGDGIAFAEAIAAKLGGSIKTHDTFGTATWTTPADEKIDIVTCRTEYYEAPGLLPVVRASNLREDLRRRDFTINALAVKINKENFGQILDFFQGQNDLKQRKIRILHTLSFVEDPTRILRAVRFALRFGYQFDEQTERLAKNAAPMLTQISASRFLRELELLHEEQHLLSGAKWLDRLGVWEALFAYQPTANDWKQLSEVGEQLEAEMEPFLALFVLFHQADNFEQKLQRYALTIADMKLLGEWTHLHSFDTREKPLRELHGELSHFSDLALQLSALLDNKPFLLDYVKKRQKITLLLNGHDLRKQGIKPGPVYSSLLQQLFGLQLDNAIRTRQEALEWLKQAAHKAE
ncbi:CBS domain-containing protein [Halalkalibacter oceani]|uniref:CBS domain-containing protein n=1 Tax=Halalkalibacter oceani TaxID=1653776 RepID=A0A9X2DSI0_9BACI|nr:CBS domain-containing protein [Halalkalibacter oceani]MCM3716229.1 CBS domain-containing protein [Halalkalibacter oceani]